jgi:putative hemolysin
MRLLALNKINRVFAKVCHLRNHAFTEGWLRELGVKYKVENEEVLERFREGAFVTVSNHPYGFIDGMILLNIIAGKRPDYRFMVNSILMKLYPLHGIFIGVKPTTTKSGSSVENTTGLKTTLRHLKAGSAVGFFPAGAVSNYNENLWKATDREWQTTVIRIVQMAKVPVIPIYIDGRNSLFFHFLGRINWQLRSVRLSREILNKHKRTVNIRVGEPIAWDEMKGFEKTEDLAAFLRAKTYSLAAK